MVDPGHVIIRPGIAMGVELQKRQRSESLGIGLEDRERDIVIPAQADTRRPGIQDTLDMRGQSVGKITDHGIVKGKIAIIHDVQLAQRIITPSVRRIGALQGTGFADGARAKAGSGPVGHRLIERHAGHREIHPREVLGIAPPQE